jgi:uncharacterized MAPEG superfamily protein
MTSTAFALTGFVAWALLLLILMEAIRTSLVMTGRVAANGFTPDNASLSPFMRRLARAHANCVEGRPIFGGLLAIAIMTARTGITDFPWLLGARIVQSITTLFDQRDSGRLRFTAFAAQMAIAIFWVIKLMN